MRRLPATAAQRSLHPCLRHVQALYRAGCDRHHRARITAGEMGRGQPARAGRERGQETGIELAQPGTQLLHELGAPPHPVLIGPGKHRDRAGYCRVVGKHSVQVGIGAQNDRQRHRIDVVALLARHRRALPIPSHGQRVDRIGRSSGGA
jgi:hypothetical protein